MLNRNSTTSPSSTFTGSSELGVGDRVLVGGLGVEVEVLDDEQTSTPAIFTGPRTVSHPAWCCSVSLDRCDRCDLLVGLEGFHLMSVARTPDALVLDVESRIQLVGCPGCGVIAQGHGRVVVEVIDAPWAGVPARIRWHKHRWICRETTCQTVTLLEHSEKVCAPRARLGVRAIRWVIRQLRFEGATVLGLARQ